MTKLDLQKELLEKVKEGVKPSDLKKPVKPKTDEGYSSDEEQKPITIPTPPILPNQKIKDLETQINSLQKRLQTYKDFKEADLKIKEKYKKEIEDLKIGLKKSEKENSSLLENIKELQIKIKEQYKTMEELKNKGGNEDNIKENQIKTFFCDSCQLTKQGIYIKRKVDAPFEPRIHQRVCYLCSDCSPYVKELSEINFDKDNNPYKID